MKRHVLLGCLLALAGPAAAQHTELIGRAGLGLLQFGGADAARTSHVNYDRENGREDGHINNPYGQRAGAGFSLGGRVQHVGRRQGLLALDLGYDWLQSRTGVEVVDLYDGQSNTARPATSRTYLRTRSLTAFVGPGYRFTLSKISLDLLAGPELAYIFGVHEKGSGTFDGTQTWATNLERGTSVPIDVRLRTDLTLWLQRVGFTTSYSYGLLNYQSGLIGGHSEVFSRILRLGLAYRLR